MPTVSVRYIVDDVDAAIDFYCQHLGFTLVMHPASPFAMLDRADLRLLLSAPGGQGGGGRSMPDGRSPAPGGWNRFALEVADLAATVHTLRDAGVPFSTRTAAEVRASNARAGFPPPCGRACPGSAWRRSARSCRPPPPG
ncbi:MULTISPECIES: VOC family protein [Arthrobacter]|uniref:VOC family protein n=1 Tax=Arthrobacter terricola TaxID=2547396 RepID=A0A4R5KE09_9MICC|nr:MULTISPECIES: VOC family protein [Arthrobacter]MBT8162670.1 VOC family protein [Arthrobacter sp. GN70]TDF92447.1 VOC family protein [Arthrobacter terricola]